MADYKDGDIVWVKYSGVWWPGEVQAIDSLPDEVASSFKTVPLAIVKFFGEDMYEYAKQPDHIYSYNCLRKNDFIRKGLARSSQKLKEGSSVMIKWRSDVATAEELTNGDPNILDKISFDRSKVDYKDIFGSGKVKKKKQKHSSADSETPRKKFKGSRGPYAKKKKKAAESFIDDDDDDLSSSPNQPFCSPDFNTYYRIQKQVSFPEEKPSSSLYTCNICGYEATRCEVYVFHLKSHNHPPQQEVKSKGKQRLKPLKPKSLKVTKKLVVKKESQRTTTSTPKSGTKRLPVKVKIEKKTPKLYSKAVAIKKREMEIKQSPEKKEKTRKNKNKKETPTKDDVLEKSLLEDWDDEGLEEEEKEEIEKLKQIKVKDDVISNGIPAETERKSAEAMKMEVEELLAKTSLPDLPSVPDVGTKPVTTVPYDPYDNLDFDEGDIVKLERRSKPSVPKKKMESPIHEDGDSVDTTNEETREEQVEPTTCILVPQVTTESGVTSATSDSSTSNITMTFDTQAGDGEGQAIMLIVDDQMALPDFNSLGATTLLVDQSQSDTAGKTYVIDSSQFASGAANMVLINTSGTDTTTSSTAPIMATDTSVPVTVGSSVPLSQDILAAALADTNVVQTIDNNSLDTTQQDDVLLSVTQQSE